MITEMKDDLKKDLSALAADDLAILSPERIFDDSVGEQVLQVHHLDKWFEVTENVFRSWTGLRRINGEDYHGPIYHFGSEDDSKPYNGTRSCGCNTCQQSVSPKLRMN